MSLFSKLKDEIDNTQVLVFAGGKAKRMGLIDKPKPLLEVCGRSLLDICISYYRDCGFKDFVLLVGYKSDMIKEHVGDGSKYGVKIRYSSDPKVEKVGKGKALRHAIETGVIDVKRRGLVVFPDDLFLDSSLPLRFLLHHIEATKFRGVEASTVLASAIEFPYGVAEVDETGFVLEFKEKPVIKLYTSTGMYMFEPAVYDLIVEMIDINEPKAVEFENTVLPFLAKRKKVYAFIVPKDVWFPINTLKQLEQADKILSRKYNP